MRPLLFLLAIGAGAAAIGASQSPQAPTPSAADVAKAQRVLRSTPLVDGHNDLPWAIRRSPDAPLDVEKYDLRTTTRGHTDLARLRTGMVGGQFWSVYIPGDMHDSGFARVQLEQIDSSS